MENKNEKKTTFVMPIVKVISSDYLSIGIAENGLFNSCATGSITDEQYKITFSSPDSSLTSFTTIKIDDIDFVFGLSGKMTKPPTEVCDLTIETICDYKKVQVIQTLQIIENKSTGYYETGMYKYTVINNDNSNHNIGVRIMIDTMIDENDGAIFNIPHIGEVTNEMELNALEIPREYQLFNSYSSKKLARGTLADGVITKPDRFVIASWPKIKVTTWDYSVDTSQSTTNDSATAIYWSPVVINPGESRKFITYYGLNTIDNDDMISQIYQTNSSDEDINAFHITRGINVFNTILYK